MSQRYDQTQKKTVRFPDSSLLDEFETWIEHHDEYGNFSAALRGLMQEAVEDDTDRSKREIVAPDDRMLARVYTEAVTLTYGSFILSEAAHLSDLAQVTTLSKGEIKALIPRLVRRSYLQQKHTGGIYPRAEDEGRKWFVKPPLAKPSEWVRNPDSDTATERQERRERTRHETFRQYGPRHPEELLAKYERAGVDPNPDDPVVVHLDEGDTLSHGIPVSDEPR